MCPCCGQGLLEKWLLTDIGVATYVCNDCNTTWLDYNNVGVTRAGSATSILDWLGYEPIDRPRGVVFLEIVNWPERTP